MGAFPGQQDPLSCKLVFKRPVEAAARFDGARTGSISSPRLPHHSQIQVLRLQLPVHSSAVAGMSSTTR